MDDTNFNYWFVMVALFNTTLGLSNIEKNTEQEKRQIRIENKLDKILEILKDEQ